jgi:deoxyribose-phosphate aldolase
VRDDVAAVVDAAGDVAIVKVILENAYLTDDEKVAACRAAEDAGAAYVKTSTGFGPGGATLDDLRLMRATVSERVKIKAAGGVRTLDALVGVLNAGVERVGATATAAIIDDLRARRQGG